MSDAGFDIETGVAGLPTAFSATYGTGELTVVICAELDALPSSEQGAPAMRMRSEDRSWNRAAAVATQGASGESEASLAPPARYGPSTGPCDADAVQ